MLGCLHTSLSLQPEALHVACKTAVLLHSACSCTCLVRILLKQCSSVLREIAGKGFVHWQDTGEYVCCSPVVEMTVQIKIKQMSSTCLCLQYTCDSSAHTPE